LLSAKLVLVELRDSQIGSSNPIYAFAWPFLSFPAPAPWPHHVGYPGAYRPNWTAPWHETSGHRLQPLQSWQILKQRGKVLEYLHFTIAFRWWREKSPPYSKPRAVLAALKDAARRAIRWLAGTKKRPLPAEQRNGTL
jgi:hypothetical protein